MSTLNVIKFKADMKESEHQYSSTVDKYTTDPRKGLKIWKLFGSGGYHFYRLIAFFSASTSWNIWHAFVLTADKSKQQQ